jgi:hypothetical protein
VVKGEKSRNFIGLVEGDVKVLKDLIVKDQSGDRA